MTATALDLLHFELPAELSATAPAPHRDGVRLLVASPAGLRHDRFAQLGQFLEPGDLVVVNTSATRPAAVDGRRGADAVTVHFATALADGSWVVEVRPRRDPAGPVADLRAHEQIELPDGVLLTIDAAHPAGQSRLWRARVLLDTDVGAFLRRVGRPIRYGYLTRAVPLRQYQTVFARDDSGAGSAEMPSAGRPFSTALVTDLVRRGVVIAPLVLHTGVSSQDAGEPPQPEWFRVPPTTARLVNEARAAGARVVAVGTTVTRALESMADGRGTVRAGSGWTELVLGPDHPARVVGGLITGWHAPGASHLQLLQAVAGPALVQAAYTEALRTGYRWHEFGDSCLLRP